MNDTTRYAAAILAHREEITAAMNLHDDALSADGLATKQRAAIARERARLLAARPAVPALRSVDDVLAELAPRTADTLALMQHEQTKIAALLGTGQSPHDVLASASPDRAIALADMIETLPEVLASQSATQIIAEQRAAVFEKLADLGVESATQARDLSREWAPARAWDRVITETADGGASIAALQDVHRVDRDGYEATAGYGSAAEAWASTLS